VAGYEIRHGRSRAREGIVEALPGLGWARGNVLGVYLHGLLEQPAVVEALLGVRLERTLDEVFERLADAVDDALDLNALDALIGAR
jgi:adenosylcobyric acid synthase